MGKRHKDDHGGHYHGEPYRALEDRPYPERIILYPGTTEDGFFTGSLNQDDMEFWESQLGSMDGVSSLIAVLPEDQAPEQSNPEQFHFYPPEQPEQLWEGAIDPEDSFLFVPGRLRIEPGTWNDLTRNDITVNWIAVDPNPERDRHAGAKILSDWIVRVGRELPPRATAGSVPGIFHLKSGELENFLIELSRSHNFYEALNNLLNDPAFKIRPGFLRDRIWEFR